MEHIQSKSFCFKKILLLAFMGFISLGIQASLLGAAWPAIRVDFRLRLDAVGALLLLGMLGSVSISLSIGRPARIFRVRYFLICGTALLGLGLFGYSLSQRWWQLMAAAFLTGAGGATYLNGANAYFSTENGVRRLNWLHASFGLGAVVSPILVATLLAIGQSWRYCFGFAGLMFNAISIGLLLVFQLFPERPIAANLAPQKGSTYSKESLRLRQANFGLLFFGVIVFFIYTGVEVTAGQWIFSLLTLERGANVVIAGLLNSMFWGGLAIGRIIMGLASTRYRSDQLVRYSMLAAIVSCILLISPNITTSAIGLVLRGFHSHPYSQL